MHRFTTMATGRVALATRFAVAGFGLLLFAAIPPASRRLVAADRPRVLAEPFLCVHDGHVHGDGVRIIRPLLAA